MNLPCGFGVSRPSIFFRFNHAASKLALSLTVVVDARALACLSFARTVDQTTTDDVAPSLGTRTTQVWTKMVKYDVRKNFADTRMRVKGRFVKKEDEALLREVMACA